MAWVIEDRNRRMLWARDTMDRSFARPLDVPALAKAACISPAHFSREFKATFSARRPTDICSAGGWSVPACWAMAWTRPA